MLIKVTPIICTWSLLTHTHTKNKKIMSKISRITTSRVKKNKSKCSRSNRHMHMSKVVLYNHTIISGLSVKVNWPTWTAVVRFVKMTPGVTGSMSTGPSSPPPSYMKHNSVRLPYENIGFALMANLLVKVPLVRCTWHWICRPGWWWR